VQLEGFSLGAFLHPLLTDSHSPHACSTPGICTFIVPQSIDCFTSPFRVSTTRWIRNSQSFVAGVGLSLGENHFPKKSLTWRELLTGLTTCLFNHGPDNPLLQPLPLSFQQGEDNNKAQYESGNGSNHSSVRYNTVLASTDMLASQENTDQLPGLLVLEMHERCRGPRLRPNKLGKGWENGKRTPLMR
jgi:hypothetical protein